MDRRSITVSGIVQGVGFRPFVHELATRLGLRGFVRNRAGEVLVELEGSTPVLDRFLDELTTRPPPLARIDGVAWVPVPPRGDRHFRIEPSEGDRAGPVFIPPDIATCDDCLRELFDPGDRRYRYPFLNCTNCGPRLTIIRGVPYDRESTTMAGFAMCAACRAEYEDPGDRRYHAQPIACPRCGPRLGLLDGRGQAIRGRDPLAFAVDALRDGTILALKSLGGYHLACDALSGPAVAELRRRKHRDRKPLAVMVRDLGGALDLCEADAAEQALLTSRRRPIVLLRRRPGGRLADEVAPGNPSLGVMLPYTPLHHLLMRDSGGSPLVMTSGNRSDEPIAYEDDDARSRLSGIADAFLTNDRPIPLRCDDSVTRVVAGVEMPIRRSRGDAPQPLALPVPCRRPTLALGGQMKVTFALGRDRHAFLSHHLGDLDHFPAYRAFVEAVGHYERLFAIRPGRVVHDLHPDYATTRYARERASNEGVELLAVQHHHAHVASCLAENGLDGPVIGVAFDGTGYGPDGTVWGGEFLVGDCRNYRRAAHIRQVGMPGGDRAVAEPWRMAAAHLRDAGAATGGLEARILHADIRNILTMLERGLNAPPTSSAGRLFDAVSSLAGIRDRVRYEGQAAMELEWLATGEAAAGHYPFEIATPYGGPGSEGALVVDTRPMIRAVADDVAGGVGPARVARRFHSTLVEVIAAVCGRLRGASGLDGVALSGGVFLNALLASEAAARLTGDGFRVYRHRQVSPGDGGLSLGQLAVAAAVEG
jgi:hydrogenase maturation protein HypF